MTFCWVETATVTESEWLSCSAPEPMLHLLHARGKASDRKLRLFAVACCRRIWHLLTDPRSRHAVEMAERFADGSATEQARAAAEWSSTEASGGAHAAVPRPLRQGGGGWSYPDGYQDTVLRAAAAQTATATVMDSRDRTWDKFRRAVHDATRASTSAAGAAVYASGEWASELHAGRHYCAEEFTQQAALVREVFGNPFRPQPDFEPAWLRWNDGTVVKLATAIYDERRFDDLPILADALEDAGCADDSILRHCREQGQVHTRGCWVLDLVLGKS